jgi:hypothetical protein
MLKIKNIRAKGTQTSFIFREAKYPPKINPERLPRVLYFVP